MFKADGNVIHFAAPKGKALQPPTGHLELATNSLRESGYHANLPLLQSTPLSHPTPSPSTETVKTRSSLNSFPESSTNSAPTPLPPSES